MVEEESNFLINSIVRLNYLKSFPSQEIRHRSLHIVRSRIDFSRIGLPNYGTSRPNTIKRGCILELPSKA
jgi:hypothetical protein